MEQIICLVMGYVFGLFQTGFIYGKSKGIDIRQHGSGNSGSTNALRVMGVKAGLIVFMGDFLKTVIPCFLVRILFRSQPGYIYVLILCAGFGVILGHNFPFYMNFKGGKGIAASSGVIFSLVFFDWKFLALGIITFFVALALTKYVSFSSLCLMTGFFLEMIIFGQLNMVHNLNQSEKIESYILVGIMMVLSYIRHKDNIKRLVNGTERKIGQKKEA